MLRIAAADAIQIALSPKETAMYTQKISCNGSSRPKQRKKPKRPMTAYNFFFQDEHARIAEEIEAAENRAQAEEEAKAKAAGEEPPTKKKARRGKKISPREKLGFEDLGKLIGKRWKEINQRDLAIYKKKAAGDAERYKLESEAYYKDQIDAMCVGYNSNKTDSPVDAGINACTPSNSSLNAGSDPRGQASGVDDKNNKKRKHSDGSATTSPTTSSLPTSSSDSIIDTSGNTSSADLISSLTACVGASPSLLFASSVPSAQLVPYSHCQNLNYQATQAMFQAQQQQQRGTEAFQPQGATCADILQAQIQQQQQNQVLANQAALGTTLMAPQMLQLQLLQQQQQQVQQPIMAMGNDLNLLNSMAFGASFLGQSGLDADDNKMSKTGSSG